MFALVYLNRMLAPRIHALYIHGKCKIDPKDNTYFCKCQDGYVGKYCEKGKFLSAKAGRFGR